MSEGPFALGIIGVVSFVSTNIDDFLLLLYFYTSQQTNFRSIFLGQILGMLAIIALSWSLSSVGELFIPTEFFPYFWTIPVCLILYRWIALAYRARNQLPKIDPKISALGFAVLVISLGMDNIAVYVPLFINSDLQRKIALSALYLILTLVWGLAAYATSIFTLSGRKRFFPSRSKN